MESQLEKRKRIAPESIKTKKTREKLKKYWEAQDCLITEKAIRETVDKIHHWISINAPHRVILKNKEIRLFDQNQNAALLSRKVQQFAERIQRDLLNNIS